MSYCHIGQPSRTPTLLSLRVALNLPNTPLEIQAQNVSKYSIRERIKKGTLEELVVLLLLKTVLERFQLLLSLSSGSSSSLLLLEALQSSSDSCTFSPCKTKLS